MQVHLNKNLQKIQHFINLSNVQVEKVKQVGSAVKDYGCNQVVKTMETPYGQFVSNQVNNALAVSEQYVDKYLPESDSEDEEGSCIYNYTLLFHPKSHISTLLILKGIDDFIHIDTISLVTFTKNKGNSFFVDKLLQARVYMYLLKFKKNG